MTEYENVIFIAPSKNSEPNSLSFSRLVGLDYTAATRSCTARKDTPKPLDL